MASRALDVRTRTSLVLSALLLSGAVHADGDAPTPDQIKSMADQAMQRPNPYKEYKPTIPVYQDMDQVKRLSDLGRLKGQQAFQDLSTQTNGGLVLPGQNIPAGQQAPAATQRDTRLQGLVVLAISSSMPLQMVRDYMAQLDGRPGVVVVLRGFINGATKIAPTGAWIEQVLRTDATDMNSRHRQVTVSVDPLIYRGLGIEQVPAVAYLPGVQKIQHCEKEVFKSAGIVYGAISVDSALKAMAKTGAVVPQEVISIFEGKS